MPHSHVVYSKSKTKHIQFKDIEMWGILNKLKRMKFTNSLDLEVTLGIHVSNNTSNNTYSGWKEQ